MNKVLLDTDILSESMKGLNTAVARHAVSYRKIFTYYTLSAATVMEVIRGFTKSQNYYKLNQFLEDIEFAEVLPFDKSIAELAGRIAGDLDRTGRPIGIADPMIAATALEHGLTLVTGNIAHYERIHEAGYPLVLANWRDA